MKKLIITPQKDTITICLPPEWVGQPIVCILEKPYDNEPSVVAEASEDSVCYKASRVLDSLPGRPPRVKRLRRNNY